MIYFSSDWHVGHDKEFIWGARHYKSITEMEDDIQDSIQVLTPNDTLYLLGDIMLGDNIQGMNLLKTIPCKVVVVRGNHDTDTRVNLYKTLPNVSVVDACYLHHNGYHFYCTHFPCITSGLERDSLKKCTCNLFGHTHSSNKFYLEMPFMLNVAWDAWHNIISIDDIITTMEDKVQDCLKYL